MRLLFGLVYLLPLTLFFSYHPVIRLGSNSSMNFELSLPLIWLVIFDLVASIALINFLKTPKPASLRTQLPGLSDRRFFLFALFPLYATISIFWSANPTRAILTAGIIWLVFFAVFALIYLLPLLKLPSNFRHNILISLFGSSIFICLVCWLQSFLDVFGVGREQTLICLGCTYQSFGFPHPSGFAIEPQFMGNLLLAPTLAGLYLVVFRAHSASQRQKLALILATSLFSATLFLTFSRGAIYAYAVAWLILLVFALVRRRFRLSLITLPTVTLIFTLAMQGVFTVLGPTHGTFLSGVTKSVHQLTLGIVDLRSLNRPQAEDSSAENNPDVGANAEPDAQPETPSFDGYVAESTDIRLSLNRIALATWSESPTRILFGVGLGAAGTAMHAAFPDAITSAKEIVQNQFFSLLLELGLVGILLVALGLVVAFFAPLLPQRFIDGRLAYPRSRSQLSSRPRPQTKPGPQSPLSRLGLRLRQGDFWSHPALPLLAALIVAYLVTLSFFSGLPNALQIYLLPPLLYLGFLENNSVQSAQSTSTQSIKSIPAPTAQKKVLQIISL